MKIHLNDFLFSVSRALDSIENEYLGVSVNHSKRAAYMSMCLCAHHGCTSEEIFDMASCAVLHDNALTEYALHVGEGEAARMEQVAFHCQSGEANARSFPFLGDTSHIILHHHENWDGTGFYGVKGYDISVRAAALRLADNVDLCFALGKSDDTTLVEVRKHLLTNRGIIYHPELTDIFLRLLDEGILVQLRNEHIDASLARIMPDCSRSIATEDLVTACGVFAAIIDARSRFTLQHTVGIAKKIAIMGDYYGFSREHIHILVVAAYLHDIGKLTTPLHILEKEGPLTSEEFTIMKGHARASCEILHAVRGFEQIATWAPSHHEKLDGSGYPHGKRADQLDRESRLLGCVDIYQALCEDRPYRSGMSHPGIMKIMRDMAANGKIDATIVEDLDTVFGSPELIPQSSVFVPSSTYTMDSLGCR